MICSPYYRCFLEINTNSKSLIPLSLLFKSQSFRNWRTSTVMEPVFIAAGNFLDFLINIEGTIKIVISHTPRCIYNVPKYFVSESLNYYYVTFCGITPKLYIIRVCPNRLQHLFMQKQFIMQQKNIITSYQVILFFNSLRTPK